MIDTLKTDALLSYFEKAWLDATWLAGDHLLHNMLTKFQEVTANQRLLPTDFLGFYPTWQPSPPPRATYQLSSPPVSGPGTKMIAVPGCSWITGTAISPQLSPARAWISTRTWWCGWWQLWRVVMFLLYVLLSLIWTTKKCNSLHVKEHHDLLHGWDMLVFWRIFHLLWWMVIHLTSRFELHRLGLSR